MEKKILQGLIGWTTFKLHNDFWKFEKNCSIIKNKSFVILLFHVQKCLHSLKVVQLDHLKEIFGHSNKNEQIKKNWIDWFFISPNFCLWISSATEKRDHVVGLVYFRRFSRIPFKKMGERQHAKSPPPILRDFYIKNSAFFSFKRKKNPKIKFYHNNWFSACSQSLATTIRLTTISRHNEIIKTGEISYVLFPIEFILICFLPLACFTTAESSKKNRSKAKPPTKVEAHLLTISSRKAHCRTSEHNRFFIVFRVPVYIL